MADNHLYYGDNLDVLRRYIASESVDLVYLDPPFNSNATYNVLFAEHTGEKAASQIQAFEDTWTWDAEAARAYFETVQAGGEVANALQAFYTLLGIWRLRRSAATAIGSGFAGRINSKHNPPITASAVTKAPPPTSHGWRAIAPNSDVSVDPRSSAGGLAATRSSGGGPEELGSATGTGAGVQPGGAAT